MPEKDTTGRKPSIHAGVTEEQFRKAWADEAGNVSATGRRLGITRRTVRGWIERLHLASKPVASGQVGEREVVVKALPAKGAIKRYIITSAQNNTFVNQKFWYALQQLADFYDAEILVGTFTYNQNSFGQLSVKRGTVKEKETELWYDPVLEGYISDKRTQLANGLQWCGEFNMLPTAVDPLSGLETYTHRQSAIFPHAKVAMRSIATMQGEGAKLNYTTGAVTLRNYIQKKEGIKAEHHHRYAALVVEVNHEGNWWVRQIGQSSKGGPVQDLDVVVNEAGVVTEGNRVEAITWGDLHATMRDQSVVDESHRMLDSLSPKFQFLHDVLEGASVNRHQLKDKNPHYAFHRWLRGYHRVDAELQETAEVIDSYLRPGVQTIIPDSNHDGWWLKSWLANHDYRPDAANAELFLELQLFMYREIRQGKMPKDVNILQQALATTKKITPGSITCLLPDESFTICNRKIECGMHGHLGPNGSRGTARNLQNIGRRANTAHSHAAGIYNGLYVAGHSSKDKWDYAYGPSSWSHSHIVTYPNGMRSIITMYAGRYRG